MLEDNGGYHVFVTYCSVICRRAEMSLVSQDMELSGAGFQEGFACSNRHTNSLAGYSKDFSSAASTTQHVQLLLNIRLFFTEPKWEPNSFENPALM